MIPIKELKKELLNKLFKSNVEPKIRLKKPKKKTRNYTPHEKKQSLLQNSQIYI